MHSRLQQLAPALFLLFVLNASASVLYVNLNSTNPIAPYTNWVTAATNIQTAVEAALDRDEILVTNGIYRFSGQGQPQYHVVYIRNKAVTLRSVNGPVWTRIEGAPGLGTTAVRCVYLGSGSTLSGFCITNGASLASSQWDYGNAGGICCESTSAVVSNCVIVANQGYWYGGGVYQGTLMDCTISGNNANYYGGGAAYSFLTNCILVNNGCTWSGNGGGLYSAIANGCILKSNFSGISGAGTAGGASKCTLVNCLVFGCSGGSGAFMSTLLNCTVTGNAATGVYQASVTNCIIYGNSPANYSFSSPYQCCSFPMPVPALGCITNELEFA